MRYQWLGITGLVLILSSVVLMVTGPRLLPTAFFGSRMGTMPSGMMNGQNGMMGGMINGQNDMMSSMVGGDPAQPFDLRFIDQMVPHHQMAVMSAQMMIANSEHPELRDLAQRIIAAQQREITQMQQWRASWFPDAPAAPATSMMSGMMNGQGGMMNGQGDMMNGQGGMMGGAAQRDRMFLEMMIPHHEAAITMARQVLQEGQHPELRTLAESIISSQSAEITEMHGYLQRFYNVTQP